MNTVPPELFIEIMSNINLEEVQVMCQSSKTFNNLCQSLSFKNMIISQLKNLNIIDVFDTLIINLSYLEIFFYAKVPKSKMSIAFQRDNDYNVVKQILNINIEKVIN